METTLIKQAQIINEGRIFTADVLIKGERIERIDSDISDPRAVIINAEGAFLIPGAIDDQVHFREPGLTHKGNIYSESRAAVAGGVTSYFEMPNTKPPATSIGLLEEKYEIAARSSLANYSFFMGTTNDNYEEIMRIDRENVCGVKIFMGSSTGNMLVDNPDTLEHIFANSESIIATHCEDEATVKGNLEAFIGKYGDSLNASHHPLIRSTDACYLSSSFAADLARKHGTRLHILHISTAKETSLFETGPLHSKKITAEACIHHLWFTDADYADKGNFIKWNPAIKSAEDREGIWKAVLDGRIDVIATDHAPHSLEEKQFPYVNAPSGGPLVQHSIQAMFDLYEQGRISRERIVEKMCHNPAILFRVKDRGYIREGYYADLVLLRKKSYTVKPDNLLYHCKWSPFTGHSFQYSIEKTFINGNLAWDGKQIIEHGNGKRIQFNPYI